MTLLYVFLTVPLKLAFALLVAVVLNYKLKAIGFFRTAYYVPSILGGSIAIAVLWRYIFAEAGLVNMILTGMGFEAVNWFGDPQNALFTLVLLRCNRWTRPCTRRLPSTARTSGMSSAISRCR